MSKLAAMFPASMLAAFVFGCSGGDRGPSLEQVERFAQEQVEQREPESLQDLNPDGASCELTTTERTYSCAVDRVDDVGWTLKVRVSPDGDRMSVREYTAAAEGPIRLGP